LEKYLNTVVEVFITTLHVTGGLRTGVTRMASRHTLTSTRVRLRRYVKLPSGWKDWWKRIPYHDEV